MEGLSEATPIDTLQRAKNDLKQGWKTPNGANCPCCGQLVKLYKRKITAMAVYELICLYKKSPTDSHYYQYFHRGEFMPNVNHSGGDWARLKHWGLIEALENTNPEKKCSGYWCITHKGRDFVEGRIKLPKYIKVYNNKAQITDSELVTVQEALTHKFNYPELMGYLI